MTYREWADLNGQVNGLQAGEDSLALWRDRLNKTIRSDGGIIGALREDFAHAIVAATLGFEP